ncbi:MAG: copper resistance protein CopC [Chloroflexota bacterium]
MLHERIRRLATAVTVAAVALVLVPGVVLGHAELETATPADKSVVTEPVAEVSGIYSEAMKPDGSSLVVKDASGTQVAKGSVDPEDDTRMVATPPSPLGDGAYTVESTTLAEDGDIEHARWTFTVAVAATPAPTPVASAAVSAAPTPTAATPVATVAPAPSPSGDGTAAASGSDVLLPIIVALIVLGAGAAYLLTRRNRPTDQA